MNDIKELTDAEIFEIALDTGIDGSDQTVLDFARELLKKAKE